MDNGESINIWEDKWLPKDTILSTLIDIDNAKVSLLINLNIKQWDRKTPPQATIQIIQIPITLTKQTKKFIWPYSKEGEYLVKTGYYIAHK